LLVAGAAFVFCVLLAIANGLYTIKYKDKEQEQEQRKTNVKKNSAFGIWHLA
jgi:hypothetical protein